MDNYRHIYSLQDIREGLERSFNEVSEFVRTLSDESYRYQPDSQWSVAENLDHLIRSGKPVAKGLRLSKLVLRAMGTARQPSRTFPELVQTYQEALAQGGKAGGPYLPEGAGKLPIAETQLSEWETTLSFFQQNLDNWSEAQLDKYRMPHPLIGKLTVREMLFFTIYHTLHHLQACRKIA